LIEKFDVKYFFCF